MDSEAIQKFYRFQKYKWDGPKYYNQPDGEDLLGKISFCTQSGFIISAPIGVLNAYYRYPFPTSHSGRWYRVFRAVGPGVGMGIAFAITTYYSTRLRQKDDFLNHSLGGIAAGTIFGAVNGISGGVLVSLTLAVLAGVLKHNPQFLQDKLKVGRSFSPYIQRNLDFSGLPELKGNWVKAEPPQK